MKTELQIQSMPVERGRIAATLTAETSESTIAISQASAEVMCRFVGTAVAPYFIIPDTEHMQTAVDMAQVNLPEFRIHLNRFLTARDPSDAADAVSNIIDKLSIADSAQALVIRPYNWMMMNMLKGAENLQETIAGLYSNLAAHGQGRILGQRAFDLTTQLAGLTDEEYYALPSAPQVSDLIGKTRRAKETGTSIKVSHIVVLAKDGGSVLALIPRKAGGAFLAQGLLSAAALSQYDRKNKGRDKDDETAGVDVEDVTLTVTRVLRFGLFYRSGSVHYVSPLKELFLLRVLVHMQKLLSGSRPYSSNYAYYEPPMKMMAKLQSVFLRIAADTLITAKGDMSNYLDSEDGRVLMEGANLAYGYESLPLFIALLACSNSVKTVEQMLLLSQQEKGGISNVTDPTPPVSLDPRFVRWLAESVLNPVLEYRNEVLQAAGIKDVPSFVKDPTFVTGAPDIAGITSDESPTTPGNGTIFGLDRLQLASITELIRLEVADIISAEQTFLSCMRGKYSRIDNLRYNGRYRDLDHMMKLIEMHSTLLQHITPQPEDVRAAATLPYRQIGFYGQYTAYEFGRTVLPIQYGVYDLAARLTRQMGSYADVPINEDGDLKNVFAYIQSSILRYEPRYMFPFYEADKKLGIKRIDFQGVAGSVYAATEGAEADNAVSILPSAFAANKLWANTAPFAQQYREIGLVSPCWDADMFQLLANLVDMQTERTYFPFVKPGSVGGRVQMKMEFKKLDPALQKMMALEFSEPPGGVSRTIALDKVPALASLGVLMPYVPRLARDLKASWMDDFAMVDITGGLYGIAGTVVLPRDSSYASAAAGLSIKDGWRAPALDERFHFKSKGAAYPSVPINFEAE